MKKNTNIKKPIALETHSFVWLYSEFDINDSCIYLQFSCDFSGAGGQKDLSLSESEEEDEDNGSQVGPMLNDMAGGTSTNEESAIETGDCGRTTPSQFKSF